MAAGPSRLHRRRPPEGVPRERRGPAHRRHRGWVRRGERHGGGRPLDRHWHGRRLRPGRAVVGRHSADRPLGGHRRLLRAGGYRRCHGVLVGPRVHRGPSRGGVREDLRRRRAYARRLLRGVHGGQGGRPSVQRERRHRRRHRQSSAEGPCPGAAAAAAAAFLLLHPVPGGWRERRGGPCWRRQRQPRQPSQQERQAWTRRRGP
mmetsp:Transcript_112400/g.195227  ORF Transcript_112400/g.195227 Transcript_112400/m.195227 type:complete len:204 (-) Transcript_112400:146-757(-)